MKNLFALLLLAISLNGFSQSKDSVPPKRDTVLLVERTDTLRYAFTFTYPNSSVVNFTEAGYIIVKGLSSTQDKPYKWAKDPSVLFTFDDKKRPVKKIIQIF